MMMTLEKFISQLDESGIISAAEIAAFQESQSPPAESAEDLGKLLVKHKKVTKLQAQLVYQGEGKQLLLGDYLILDKIGAGGMGDVYLAEHRRMKRQVALKTLPTTMTKDEQAIQRFHREVQAAAKLAHPNIVTAHDAGEDKNIHYFVMEHVDGIDLSAVVKKQGVLKVDVAIDYILQAAKGLEFAHSKGVIHRDIKPANMLLDNAGTIKILDMGLARIEDEAHEIPATQLTQDGSVMGTVDYMAPEQAKDTHTADARSDIYSLGCSLYYLLTGESVYRGSTMVNRIMAHQNEPIPSLTGKHILISQDVDAVFQKMVAKRPEDRFQSMSEVISAIENCIQMKSSSTVSTEPPDPELQKFLQSQKVASNPTVVMSADAMTAEKPLTDTQNESLTSGFLNHTLGGTSYQPLAKRKQSIGKRGWMLMGAVLAPLFLMAGIVFKVDTSAGTIILEIDQPELAGAVVSIDEQQKITIKTGEGQEPIEVVADEKTHTLQVTKGGFETFTKQFTVKAGGKETIKVRLVPLNYWVYNTDRAVAEWVIGMGGSFKDDRGIRYSKRETLPIAPFHILEVRLKDANVKDDDLKRLAGLNSLKYLFLEGTLISDTGLQYLRDMQELELENLSLDYTKITDEGLVYIKEMPSLKRLTLIKTNITNSGLKSLKDMKQLVKLNLAYLQIDDVGLGYLEDLTILDELRINDTQITDSGLKHLRGMKNLNFLQLGGTGITSSGLVQLDKLENLVFLDFTKNKITDSGLTHLNDMKKLKTLGLRLTLVTDLGLQHLHGLKNLESLNLQETKVTIQGIADLQKALPNCKIISDFGDKLPPSEKENYALEFDGKSSYVRSPKGITIDLKKPVTVELSLKVNPNSSVEENSFFPAFHSARGFGLNAYLGEKWIFGIPDANLKMRASYMLSRQIISSDKTYLAGVWNGEELTLFVNGVQQGNPVKPGNPVASIDHFVIGSQLYSPNGLAKNTFFKGIIDEVRISNIARYTKDFTPAKRFKTDEHTLALYHFDEGNGDVLKDSSGNGHDGKIVGAKWVKVDDELQVVGDLIFMQPLSDAEAAKHRKLAEWVIQHGGYVNIEFEGESTMKEILLEGNWGVREINKLPSKKYRLWRISFSGRKEFNDEQLKEMVLLCEGLNTIHNLNFIRTSITDVGLEYLTDIGQQLWNIGVSSNEQLSDSGLLSIAKLEGLKELTFNRQNKFTAAGIVKLQKTHPNLRIDSNYGYTSFDIIKFGGTVGVETNDIVFTSITNLEGFPNPPYKRFEIDTQKHVVSDDDLWWFGRIIGLTSLSMQKSEVTDVGIPYLKRASLLSQLHLSGEKITDASVAHLSQLTNLKHLDITQTSITMQGATKLKSALPNCEIVHKPPATKAP